MAQLSYRDAVVRAIAQEMRRDESVVFLGEDIGAAGGVFKATPGLLEEFGPRESVQTVDTFRVVAGLEGRLPENLGIFRDLDQLLVSEG